MMSQTPNANIFGTKPFFEIFGLIPEDYDSVSVSRTKLSTRAKNRLLRSNVRSVCDLIKLRPCDLEKLSSLGKITLDEIISYVASLEGKEISALVEDERKAIDNGWPEGEPNHKAFYEIYGIEPQFYEIKSISEFSFSRRLENRFERLNIKTAADLLRMSISDFSGLSGFGRTSQAELNDFFLTLSNKEETIELKYADSPVEGFIKAYSDDTEIRSALMGLKRCENMSVGDFVDFYNKTTNPNMEHIADFINWCHFDVQEDVSFILRVIEKNEKWKTILQLRSQKKTLEAVGNELGVTRERARQLEKKAQSYFDRWVVSSRILWKVFAIRGGDTVLTPTELSEYFGTYNDVFVYLLKNSEICKDYYDGYTDAFIMGDLSLAERAQEYIDSLSETFKVSDKNKLLNIGTEEYGIPNELLERTLDESYSRTGEVYHRHRLVLKKIYLETLDRYYPNGMHIYDTKVLEEFKGKVEENYGISMADKSDRSIISILFNNGILCGRGRYKLNKGHFISPRLKDCIEKYIDESVQPIVLVGAVFETFEEELLEEGIDNKYFLQGILRDLYDERWFFKRDYIAKDQSVTTVYTSIVNFIKHSKYPVSKEDIIREFPGLTEIVLQMAVSDNNVINLFGTYIHSDSVRLSDSEKTFLRSVLEDYLSQRSFIHVKDIFPVIMAKNPTVLSNNYIMFSFGLFSLLEYLFRDEFTFSRPYISKDEMQIDKARDIIDAMIADNEIISISEIQSVAREYHFQIYSILDFIDSCNGVSLLINSSQIMHIDATGVNKDVVSSIEKMIMDEITQTVPVAKLECISRFPTINVPWTDWLIYSALKKWGTQLEVAPSSEKYKQSFPVVSPKGHMSLDNLSEIDKMIPGKIFVADDLDNIDDLISDYILDEGY